MSHLSPKTLASTITKAVHALMLSRSGPLGAIKALEREGEHGAVSYLRTAVDAMSTSNTSELVSHPATVAFMQSLSTAGLFDAVRSAGMQVPLHSRVVWTTTAIAGYSVDEGKPKPVSVAAFESPETDPVKAHAHIAATLELLRVPNALDWLNAELRNGAALAADAKALPLLTAGAGSVASSGTTAAAFRTDMGNAYALLNPGPGSRIIVGVSPAQMGQVALLDGMLFADLGVTGGTAAGMQFVVSGALGTDIVLVDAAQVVIAGGEPEFREGPHASVEMNTTPADPVIATTTQVSMFQHNMTALLAERFFTLKARDGAVSKITGANYGA